jgi:hypothetical protein
LHSKTGSGTLLPTQHSARNQIDLTTIRHNSIPKDFQVSGVHEQLYPDSSTKKVGGPGSNTQITVEPIQKAVKSNTVHIGGGKIKEISSPVLTNIQYKRKQTVKVR